MGISSLIAEGYWKVALHVVIMQSLKLSPVENWDGILIEGDALAGVTSLALENKEKKCNYNDYGIG